MPGPYGDQDAEDVEHLRGHFVRSDDIEDQHSGSNGQRYPKSWNVRLVSYTLWVHLASAFQGFL
ncbi:MAG: hypothetical protein ACREIK_06255, partial [Nitrospiraceae bacterium]